MPNKFSIDKKILLLAGLVVFLLVLIILPKEAKAKCCVSDLLKWASHPCYSEELDEPCKQDFSSLGNDCAIIKKCKTAAMCCASSEYRRYSSKTVPCNTTYPKDINNPCDPGFQVLAGDCATIEQCEVSLPTPESKPKRVIKFIPNITIPGSITIGGKEIRFVAGEATEVTGATLGAWISLFYMFFCGVIGILAAVNIIFGGFKYLTSFGNASRISAAKERITSAVIGLFLTLGAFIILQTINPRLVEFRNLSINQIRTILQIEAEGRSLKGAPAVVWDGKNVVVYDTHLLNFSLAYDVDRNWLKALMLIESGGDPNAVSPAGACGLIQLLPSTANLTCEELKNPRINIMAAAKYYASLMGKTCPAQATTTKGETVVCDLPTNCKDGASTYANAAYNGGLGANCSSHDKNCTNQTWWECENNDGFAETRAYVQKVQQAYDKIVENGW